MTTDLLPSITEYRALIDAALLYAGGTHTFDDIAKMVEQGDAQFWPGPNSCVVTQLSEEPQRKVVHFFLAAGAQAELRAMEPGILDWARANGCTKAQLAGRRGWLRSFLVETGWKHSLIVMDKEL